MDKCLSGSLLKDEGLLAQNNINIKTIQPVLPREAFEGKPDRLGGLLSARRKHMPPR